MNEILQNSMFFGGVITIIGYTIGERIKKRWNKPWFNPLLVGIIIVIIFLSIFSIDVDIYSSGAKYITYLLTPATVSLAVPLYEEVQVLRKNFLAVMGGIIAGAITSAICVLSLSVLFGLTHKYYVTLLPKSITNAIGMGLSEKLGGYATITVAVIVITGVLGNIIAEQVCKIFKIKNAVARGVAIGSSSHAAGTAKAMEMGEVEGAMSSLSIAVSGIITVIIAGFFSGISF